MQEAQSCNAIGAHSGQRTSWDDFKKKYFVELLRNNGSSHSRYKNGWTHETWRTVTEEMKTKFPESAIDIVKLKQLERDLKKQVYQPVKAILDRYNDYIQWDSKYSMLDASNETWAMIYKVDAEAMKWRSKIIPYYLDLAALYEGHEAVERGPQAGPSRENGCDNFPTDLSSQYSQHFYKEINNYSLSVSTPSIVPANQDLSSQINLPSNPSTPTHTLLVPQPSSPQQVAQPEFLNANTLPPMCPLLNEMLESCQQPPNSQTPAAPNNIEFRIPSPNHGNVNTEMGNDLTLSSPAQPSFSLQSSQEGDGITNRSNKVPEKNITHNIIPTKKTGAGDMTEASSRARVRLRAKVDFSIRRCIKIFNKLPELQVYDIHHVVSIFKDEQNREAFVTLKKKQKIYWLKREMQRKYFI